MTTRPDYASRVIHRLAERLSVPVAVIRDGLEGEDRAAIALAESVRLPVPFAVERMVEALAVHGLAATRSAGASGARVAAFLAATNDESPSGSPVVRHRRSSFRSLPLARDRDS